MSDRKDMDREEARREWERLLVATDLCFGGRVAGAIRAERRKEERYGV